VLVDVNGIVVGLGQPARATGPAEVGGTLPWFAYGSVHAPRERIAAWAVMADGAACELGAAGAVASSLLSDEEVGEGLGLLAPFVAGDWRPVERGGGDGAPLAALTSTDAGRGLAALAFHNVVSGAAVAVPVRTGPVAFGTSVQLVDVETLAVVARLVPPPSSDRWLTWRAPIPAGLEGRWLAVVARDDGQGPGQRIALGALRRVLD
jgi:hypothetical protein